MSSRIVKRLIEGGAGGKLALINSRPQVIEGLETLQSARDAAFPIDHALIAVPAAAVASVLEDASAAGARLATVLSSGFSEIGQAGSDLDMDLRRTAQHLGIRLIGPNCLGFVSFRDCVWASTMSFKDVDVGPVSVVGQSGSVATRLVNGLSAAGTGLDLAVTIGNSVDIGPPEILDYLVARASTKVVVFYLENIGQPDRMREAIENARATGKSVVVLKAGRTEAGAKSAASHTGATASKDVFVDLLLHEAGAIRVRSVREACDVAGLLAAVGPLNGRAAVVAPSGGDCTIAADSCAELGIPLAIISEEGQAAMRAAVPICAPQNPIDPTTMARGLGKFTELLEIAAAEKDVDYMVYLTSTTLMRPDAYAGTVESLKAAKAKGIPVIAGAPISPAARKALNEAGIGVVDDSDRVFRAVRYILENPRPRDEKAEHKTSKPHLMDELEASRRLRAAGLPMIETVVVENRSALKGVAARLGYPWVLKGIAQGVAHKSGLGLVKLDLSNLDELATAYDDVAAKVASVSGATIVVQPAVGSALAELLVGVVSDPVFGKHVTLGMGGVFTDFLRERVWARAPVDAAQAASMLDRLSIGPGLKGQRKGVHGCVEGVIDAVVRLSRWAVENDAEIEEVEINPLLVRRDDVMAVDALVSLRNGGSQ
jgi:acyl-CoA synthetase (NDP forming)